MAERPAAKAVDRTGAFSPELKLGLPVLPGSSHRDARCAKARGSHRSDQSKPSTARLKIKAGPTKATAKSKATARNGAARLKIKAGPIRHGGRINRATAKQRRRSAIKIGGRKSRATAKSKHPRSEDEHGAPATATSNAKAAHLAQRQRVPAVRRRAKAGAT